MTADRFAQRLEGLFSEADRELEILFSRLLGQAAHDRSINSSGFGLFVIGEFEALLRNTVNEALKSYDHATNAVRHQRAERAGQIKMRIEKSVEAAVELTQPKGNAFRDIWPEIIKREAPALRKRLVFVVDQHLTGLAGTGVQRPFEAWWKQDWRARVAIFVVGALAGALIAAGVARLLPAKPCRGIPSAAGRVADK